MDLSKMPKSRSLIKSAFVMVKSDRAKALKRIKDMEKSDELLFKSELKGKTKTEKKKFYIAEIKKTKLGSYYKLPRNIYKESIVFFRRALIRCVVFDSLVGGKEKAFKKLAKSIDVETLKYKRSKTSKVLLAILRVLKGVGEIPENLVVAMGSAVSFLIPMIVVTSIRSGGGTALGGTIAVAVLAAGISFLMLMGWCLKSIAKLGINRILKAESNAQYSDIQELINIGFSESSAKDIMAMYNRPPKKDLKMYNDIMSVVRENNVNKSELRASLALLGGFEEQPTIKKTVFEYQKAVSLKERKATTASIIGYYQEEAFGLKKKNKKKEKMMKEVKQQSKKLKKGKKEFAESFKKIQKENTLANQIAQIKGYDEKFKALGLDIKSTHIGKLLYAAAKKKGFKPKDNDDSVRKMLIMSAGAKALSETIGDKKASKAIKELTKVSKYLLREYKKTQGRKDELKKMSKVKRIVIKVIEFFAQGASNIIHLMTYIGGLASIPFIANTIITIIMGLVGNAQMFALPILFFGSLITVFLLVGGLNIILLEVSRKASNRESDQLSKKKAKIARKTQKAFEDNSSMDEVITKRDVIIALEEVGYSKYQAAAMLVNSV